MPVFRFYEFPTDEVKNAIIEKVVEQSEGCLHFGYMEIEGIDDKSFCFCPVKEFDVEIFEFENTPRILKSKNAKTILTEKECRLYGLPYTNKNSYRAEVSIESTLVSPVLIEEIRRILEKEVNRN